MMGGKARHRKWGDSDFLDVWCEPSLLSAEASLHPDSDVLSQRICKVQLLLKEVRMAGDRKAVLS